jgi:hypothetical protein
MSATALILAAFIAHHPGDSFALPGAQVTACPDLRQNLEKASSSTWIQPGKRNADPRREVRARLVRLGELPKANATLGVLRSIDGCAISSTTRYDVEGDGRAAY